VAGSRAQFAVRRRLPLGVAASARGVDRFGQTARFGAVVAVLTAITAGVNLAKNAAGLGPVAKKVFAKHTKKADMWRVQMIRAQRQMERAKSKGAKRRARRRFLRYRERWHLEKLRQALVAEGVAKGGPLLDGTALEIRRNMLVAEWDSASPSGRVDIEKLIGNYDKKTDELYRQWQAMGGGASPGALAPGGSPARFGLGPIPRPPPDAEAPGSAEEAPYTKPVTLHEGPIQASNLKVNERQALVTGIGGLGFVSTSPPGGGRLVRVAFYPATPAQSYSGANGIVSPGDDPVLMMTLTSTVASDFVLSADHVIETELFDYGRYRVVGLQCHHQSNFVVQDNAAVNRTTAVVQGCAVTVRSLEVYNGEKMLLPLEELDVNTFDIFGGSFGGYPGISSTSLTAYQQQAPYNFRSRSKGFFMGLRTNPVLEGTAKLRMVVRSFISVVTNDAAVAATGMLAGDTLEVPISFNVIGDMLEDKVFGDPVMPSPASRAGAQVHLGAKDLGQTSGGEQRLQIINPRYRLPVSADSRIS